LYKKDKTVADILAVGFTVMLVISGAALLAIGYLDLEFLTFTENTKEYFKKVGEYVFVAGAFTAFLKTIQIMKVVKDDLVEILYSESFISEYLDVNKLWKKLYRIIHNKLYPKLPKSISEKIIEKNVPRDIDYYIEDFSLNIVAGWADRDQGIVEIRGLQYQRIKLVREEGAKISRISHSPISDEDVRDYSTIHKLYLDNVDVMNQCRTEVDFEQGKITNFSFEIKEDCTLEEHSSIFQNIRRDPVYNFKVTKYVDRLSIKLVLLDEDLEVSFLPFGDSEEWIQSRSTFMTDSVFTVMINDLYFPDQGFTLLFKVKKS
jgi:hypothetical protein